MAASMDSDLYLSPLAEWKSQWKGAWLLRCSCTHISAICPKHLSATYGMLRLMVLALHKLHLSVSTDKKYLVPGTRHYFFGTCSFRIKKKSSQVLAYIERWHRHFAGTEWFRESSPHYCVINSSFARTKKSSAIPCLQFLNSSAFVAVILFVPVSWISSTVCLCWSVLRMPLLCLVCV